MYSYYYCITSTGNKIILLLKLWSFLIIISTGKKKQINEPFLLVFHTFTKPFLHTYAVFSEQEFAFL